MDFDAINEKLSRAYKIDFDTEDITTIRLYLMFDFRNEKVDWMDETINALFELGQNKNLLEDTIYLTMKKDKLILSIPDKSKENVITIKNLEYEFASFYRLRNKESKNMKCAIHGASFQDEGVFPKGSKIGGQPKLIFSKLVIL
jgi:hypothetical protein